MDTWLINKTQAVYDWLFDRTGVYNATLRMMVLITLLLPDVYRVGLSWFDMALLTFWGVACGVDYVWQDKKMYTTYNSSAMKWESSTARYMIIPFVLFAIFKDIVSHPWDIPFDCMFIVWSYLQCCKIRDREPPETRELSWQT